MTKNIGFEEVHHVMVSRSPNMMSAFFFDHLEADHIFVFETRICSNS